MREGKNISGDSNKGKLGDSSPPRNDAGAQANTAPVTPSTPEQQTTTTAAGSVTAEAGVAPAKPSAQEKQVSTTMDGTKSDESSSSSGNQEDLPSNAWKRNTDKLAAIRQAVLKVSNT